MRNLRPFRSPGRWRTLSPTQTRIQSPLHHKVKGSCQSQGRCRFRFRGRSPAARDNPSRRGGTFLFRFLFSSLGGRKSPRVPHRSCFLFPSLLSCFRHIRPVLSEMHCQDPGSAFLVNLLWYKRKRRLRSLPRPGYRTRPRVRFRYPHSHYGSSSRRGQSRRSDPLPR